MTLAPIVLFVYNRLEHTRRTVEALLGNDEAQQSDLYIYADGPKNEQDKTKVELLRNYISTIVGFRSIHITEREENFGLAKSVIAGVTEVVNRHGNIIVVEDDTLVSPYFLAFMNDGLNYYAHEQKVISIHGYTYPVKQELPETFFLKGADCWGWATWKRGWDLFEPDGSYLLKELNSRNLAHEFDFFGAYNYTDMLEKQIRGENSSWAIRWYATAFLLDKLTLYPGKSLVHNIGNDNSGIHAKKMKIYDAELSMQPIKINPDLPLEENRQIKKIIAESMKRHKYITAWNGLVYSIRKKLSI